mmetsp:Transcript_16915/g.66013  ORF Transcript_16915/g.66013 Transcript_16915/m.66013 type:complete len:417 (+) Transcript_16915:97-1347(+)
MSAEEPLIGANLQEAPASATPRGMSIPFVYLCCFFGGLAPLISWNTIYVSESYFGYYFGSAFLSIVGLCQNVPSLLALLLLIALNKSGATDKFLPYFPASVICVVLQTAGLLGIAIIIAVGGDSLDDVVYQVAVYGIVVGNGLTTGIGSGRLFSLAAEFPARASAMMIAGAAAGALIPTGYNIAFLWLDSPQNLYVVFSLGVATLVVCLVVLAAWRKSKSWDIGVNGEEEDPDAEWDPENPGKQHPDWSMLLPFFRRVAPLAGGCFWTMTISLSLLSIVGVVPLSNPDHVDLSFWLIAVYNVGDLVGRQLGSALGMPTPALLVVMALRTLLWPVVLVYIFVPYFQAWGDLYMVLVYFFISSSSGFCLAVASNNSQLICGFSMQDVCPIVGAIVATAIQTGLVFGIILSFGVYPFVS